MAKQKSGNKSTDFTTKFLFRDIVGLPIKVKALPYQTAKSDILVIIQGESGV